MDILNKAIKSFGFEEVVDFCKEKHPEGIQIDYKKEFPKKGLSKHFAAFSNARGGVIIVGVDEDKRTSIPKSWSGIKNEGKLEERVHQFASNVKPIPAYELQTTDEKNGKVFLLIRIFEGDRTPYYVQNDANLWIRTGNITRLIDRASPDEVELLFGKRNKAEKARRLNEQRITDVFDAGLKRAEKERIRLIAEEKEKFERKKQEEEARVGASTLKYKSEYLQANVGSNVSMATILLQPFYPQKAFIRPSELKDSLEKIRVTSRRFGDFPSLNVERIPDGVFDFGCNYQSGAVDCEQIYSNGLIHCSVDVVCIDNANIKNIWLSHITSRLFIVLRFAIISIILSVIKAV